jgi:hypothetical protein
MIRLPKYDEKIINNNNIDNTKKLLRKSFSPNRNYSEGIKKSSNPTPHVLLYYYLEFKSIYKDNKIYYINKRW